VRDNPTSSQCLAALALEVIRHLAAPLASAPAHRFSVSRGGDRAVGEYGEMSDAPDRVSGISALPMSDGARYASVWDAEEPTDFTDREPSSSRDLVLIHSPVPDTPDTNCARHTRKS